MQQRVIKKYANRRLYDTADSRYITLEELAERVRAGAEVRVVDAASGEDLTQATLAQIIFESRGAARLLPVSLLARMIRLGDDALGDFLGRWVAGALELYLQARSGAQQMSAWNPLATMPFSAGNALARMMAGAMPWGGELGGGAPPGYGSPMGTYGPPPMEPPPAPPENVKDEVAELRRQMEELRREMKPRGKKR